MDLLFPACALRTTSLALAATLAGSFLGVPTAALAQDNLSVRSVVRLPGETRIEKQGDLHFGDILAGNTGGTITLGVNGAVSTTGTVQSLGGDPQPAEFVITRTLLADFPTYSGPAGSDSVLLTHINAPGETMVLRNFTTDFNRTIFFGLPAYLFRTSYDFRVAGTLDVEGDQEPGQYLGFFTVTIDYD
ncbi:DUF4402 domain-containing protein [Qipengyuania sp. ASV99]|uniref:DUF4402 domain-containing protein n=1 Tax=Qipengyuania sp. ASV99 TaxID=3399681 RepID=UPI003A4C6969